jgi:hypothetical protein
VKKLFLWLLLFPITANAAPCSPPSFYDGYSYFFQNTSIVSGFIYGLDERFLYTVMPSGYVNGFINVPQSATQAFYYSKTPDSFYQHSVVGVYRETLMTESCQNILTDDGKYLVLG